MKEWFTPREIAEAKLPGMPETEQGIRLRATQWRQETPQLCRDRSASGGGREYHRDLLPLAARRELDRRDRAALEGQALAAYRAAVTTGALPAPATAPNAATPLLPFTGGLERFDAKAAVLTAFDAWRLNRPRPSDCRAREMFVEQWNAGEIVAPAFARDREPRLSEPTLRRWLAARAKGDMTALQGRYGNRRGTSVWDTDLSRVRAFITAALARLPDLTTPNILDLVEHEFGQVIEIVDGDGVVTQRPLPSPRAVQKLVKRWRDDNPSLVKRLTDPDGWRNSDMLALGDAAAGIERPNQVWMIDASPQDVITTEGRYQIYALIDVHPRRLMVLVTKTPRTEAVKLLLRAALLSWGVPDTLVTDNGSDFVSKEARRVFAALKIAHDPATPFSPWEKSFVERVIGTIQHGLFPMMPGYCGHNVAAAQKLRARRTFAARMGETEREAFEVALTADQVQVLVNEWVALKYDHHKHGGLGGKTPFQVLSEWTGAPRRISDERALDMLLCRSQGTRQITKKGLRVGNRRYWDRNGGLLRFARSPEPLEVRMDPANPRVAYVYRPDPLEYICTVECLDLMTPAERAEVAVRARIHQRKALTEQERAVKAGGKAIGRADVLAAALENGRKRNGTVVALPRAGTEHSTPALDAAAIAAAAQAPATPAPLTASQQAAQDRVVVALQRPAPPPVSDEDRWWARAMDIRHRRAEGDPVTPSEAQWLAQVEGRPWFRARDRFAALTSGQVPAGQAAG